MSKGEGFCGGKTIREYNVMKNIYINTNMKNYSGMYNNVDVNLLQYVFE